MTGWSTSSRQTQRSVQRVGVRDGSSKVSVRAVGQVFGQMGSEMEKSEICYGIAGVWDTPKDRAWWRNFAIQGRNQHALCLSFLMLAERLWCYLDYKTLAFRLASPQYSDDICSNCISGGKLMICDRCPRAYHPVCVGLDRVPKGEYVCPFCKDSE